jgi:hypothetical protein
MAFLSWLKQLGFTLSKIAPSMVKLTTLGTLAQLYVGLTTDSQPNAWPQCLAAAKALPRIASDEPFGTIGTKTKMKQSALATATRGSESGGKVRTQIRTHGVRRRLLTDGRLRGIA